MTPANSNLAGPQMKLAIPATPSLTRPGMLRHFQSSPSLPRMDTSVHTFGRPSQLGFAKHTTPESDPKEDDEEEQNFDIPQSREEKPEAYPNGPICVYEPHIDLYLEPTAQQALEYDVILNVASEVRNPFTMDIAPPELEPEIVLDGGGGMRFAPRRNLPLKSSGSAHLENPLSAVPESSPSTPRATPPHDKFPMEPEDLTDKKQPEYIHIPWEHNTDIVPDLLRLVRIIDDRVQNGKRVLIHCQCGVSRSATLVVAYGLYKDPSMSVREAYDAVKARSKWIGPNMNLIMQLQEFAGSLTRPNVKNNIYGGTRHLSPILTSPPYEQWARPDPLPEATAEPTAPKTAPLVSENVSPQEATARSNVLGVSPGPSSAPSGLSWPSRADVSERPTESKSTRKESAAYVDPAGHVVPVVKIIEDNSTPPARRSSAKKARPLSLNLGGSTSRTSTAEVAPAPFLSPRSEEFSMTALQPPQAVESEDRFGLLSPRATEFAHSPLDRTSLLGALGMGSTFHSEQLVYVQAPPTGQASSRKLPLRPKLSSPSLSEQKQLQSYHVDLEASLGQRAATTNHASDELEALMSPRATEFTQNPFALALETPHQTEAGAPHAVEEDPRSPAQKGASPIVRNIFDVL